MKIIVLFSGGMDSTVLYHMLKKNYPSCEVKALYYDFGQPYAEWEIRNLPDFVEVRNVDWLKYDKSVHCDPFKPGIMWGREQFLTVLAFMQEKPDKICLGVLVDEVGEDMSNDHRELTQSFLTSVNPMKFDCEIEYTLADLGYDKIDVVKWAISNNVDIAQTVSCMGNETPCMKCVSCVQREIAFLSLGISSTKLEVKSSMLNAIRQKRNTCYADTIADLQKRGLLDEIPDNDN